MNTRRVTAIALIGALACALSIGCTVGPSTNTTAGASSPAGPASPAAGNSPGIPAAIVGSWTTTITEADLRAGGVTGEGELAENTGVFTMTFGADGTWSASQVAAVPRRWPVYKGTLVALGPDSFRQVTTFPADYAGDSVDFTWSIKDGALVMHVLNPPDKILPIITETHPWQRKG